MKMKKMLNEWKEFLNENEREDLTVRKMMPAGDIEYFKMIMENDDRYVAEYDPSSEEVTVWAIHDAGGDLAAAALRYIQQDLPYDQERFPEPEDDLEERCQKGYKTHPTRKTKKMYGKTYRNCVKAEE
tara:strand:- start:61 stop:444 length:384 start_codon:yes stop_codon:yes gene_type:complete